MGKYSNLTTFSMEVFEKYRSEAAVVNNPEVKKIKEDMLVFCKGDAGCQPEVSQSLPARLQGYHEANEG